jgi:hypothetical protein
VLPLPLGEIAGDPDRPEKPVLTGRDHAICNGVAEVLDILMGNVVLVKRWLTIVDDGKHSAAIVARIKDAEGPPLLATRTFPNGGGEVALFAVTADKFWSNLPSTDLFLVLVNQMHRAMARRQDPSGLNLLPDGTLRLLLDPAVYRADATVRALAGDDERTFTAVEGKEPSAPAILTVTMAELRALGAYEIDLVRHDGAPDKRLVARNLPNLEGRLLAFPDQDFARLYPQDLHDRVTFVREETSLGDERGEGEVWPFLAALLLVGLLLESLLAWRFGRR